MAATTTEVAPRTPLLSLRGMRKAFGGVVAVDDVDLELAHGEVLGLVGGNGAGKSTLVRMLAGVVAPDAGRVTVDGREVQIGSARDAHAAGISVIHQELQLIDTFSIAENLHFGRSYPRRRGGAINWARIRRDAADAFAEFGHEVDVSRAVSSSAPWERWLTEVVRALRSRARVLVLDEPTAAMDADDVGKLFAAVRRLTASGAGVIFVSHRLNEVRDICDRVQVMRDGGTVATLPASQLDTAALVELIGGHAPGPGATRRTAALRDDVVLSVRGIVAGDGHDVISFDVAAGEIVGIAGLVGSGRSTLLRTLSGARPARAGTIDMEGQRIDVRSPGQALRSGIALLPEDRLTEGLVTGLPLSANIALAGATNGLLGGRIRDKHERRRATTWIEHLSIRGASARGPISTLSGGNQQKVLFARLLEHSPRVLILDEPSRGVDVAARAGIHELIAQFAEQGGGVLVVSSDFDELVELADRVLVVRERRLVGELRAPDLHRNQILKLCYGH